MNILVEKEAKSNQKFKYAHHYSMHAVQSINIYYLAPKIKKLVDSLHCSNQGHIVVHL